MPPKSRLSTVGLANPIVLKYSISFNEVTIVDILDQFPLYSGVFSVILWDSYCLNPGKS